MKENKIISVGDKRTFENLDLAVVIGLQNGDETDRMFCGVNGGGSVHDFAKVLNGMRRAIGDRMFMDAVLAEAMLQMSIEAAEYDAEEDE